MTKTTEIEFVPRPSVDAVRAALYATARVGVVHNIGFESACHPSFDAERTRYMAENGVDGAIIEALLAYGPDQLLGRETHGWFYLGDNLYHTEVTRIAIEWVVDGARARYVAVQTIDNDGGKVERLEYPLFRTAQAAAQHAGRNLKVCF
jgi:hypothetical protein